MAYVNSNIDDLRIFGTKVDFEDGDSPWQVVFASDFRRCGAATRSEPFIGASAWYEFLGENDVAMNSEASS